MSDPKLNTPSSSEMQIDNLQSNDFSLLELFFKADAVVMLVMLSLIFLSIWCWAIIFNKYFKFKNEIKTRDNFEQYYQDSEAFIKALTETLEAETTPTNTDLLLTRKLMSPVPGAPTSRVTLGTEVPIPTLESAAS